MNTRRQGALRWAVLTCLIAATVGTIAYLVGISSGEESASGAYQPDVAPGLIELSELYHQARRRGFADGKRRAYVQGRLDGLEEGRRAERRRLARERERIRSAAAGDALEGLSDGGWFLVTLGADGRSIGERAGPLDEGLSYRLCRDGGAVCTAPR